MKKKLRKTIIIAVLAACVVTVISVLAGCAGTDNAVKGAVTAAQAESMALSAQGLTKADVSYITSEAEREDGKTVYEVKFVKDGVLFDVKIDAATGSLISVDTENAGNVGSSAIPDVSGTIGAEAALNAALAHAGVTDPYNSDVDYEYEGGKAIFDVEFEKDGYEYDYVVDAATGEIISFYKKSENDFPSTMPSVTETIGSDAALNAALAHAGVTDPYNVDVDYDYERGTAVFELEFHKSGYEYEYVVDAATGEILYSLKKYDEEYSPSMPDVTATIGAEAALNAALTHAGVTSPYDVETEYDYEGGKAVFEVEFKKGGYEYDYVVDALSGEIIRFEKERD